MIGSGGADGVGIGEEGGNGAGDGVVAEMGGDAAGWSGGFGRWLNCGSWV